MCIYPRCGKVCEKCARDRFEPDRKRGTSSSACGTVGSGDHRFFVAIGRNYEFPSSSHLQDGIPRLRVVCFCPACCSSVYHYTLFRSCINQLRTSFDANLEAPNVWYYFQFKDCFVSILSWIHLSLVRTQVATFVQSLFIIHSFGATFLTLLISRMKKNELAYELNWMLHELG